MKNIVLFIILLLTLSTSAEAVSTNPFLVPCGATGLCPTTQYRDLGTETSKVGTIYAENLNISTALVLGGAVSGNVNMANYDINNAGGIYADATEQRGWSFDTASQIIGKIGGGAYYIFKDTGIQFNGSTVNFTTAATNTGVTIDPNGTGIVKLGDTSLASLSSLGTNGTLTYDLEVLNNLFTGGITMATNRGDVPWIDWSVTSASADGTAQSLPILIDGQFIASFYAESDGAGSIDTKEVRTVSIRNYGDLITERMTLPNDTTLPATCTVGEVFMDTDSDDCADTGGGDGALCICKTTNTWALVANI